MSKRILLYSDGYYFGGSEYVVVNIFKNRNLNKNYEFLFAYRAHKDYQKHIDSLFDEVEKKKLFPLKVLSLDNLYNRIEQSVRISILQRILKFAVSLFTRLQICNIYNYFLFKRFLKRIDIEGIHINNGGFPGAESCLVMAKAAKDTGHSVVLQINNIPNHSKKYWDRIIKKSVDAFIIASKYTSGKIVSLRDITNDNICTLRDNVKMVYPTKAPEDLMKELDIASDSIVLIQVALLLEYKGQIYTLEAINKMRDENKAFFDKVVLLLIGSGELEEKLKSYISDNHLEGHVKMLGYRNDYINYVNMADIMVHPTRANEDMPLIILSAMSLGKPVISCNFAGIPEEVEHLKSGILLDPQSDRFVDDLCKAIPLVYEKKKEFGRRGKEIFDAEFSEHKYEEGLSFIYDHYLNRQQK